MPQVIFVFACFRKGGSIILLLCSGGREGGRARERERGEGGWEGGRGRRGGMEGGRDEREVGEGEEGEGGMEGRRKKGGRGRRKGGRERVSTEGRRAGLQECVYSVRDLRV